MPKKYLSILNLWLPPLMWACVIFLFSALPSRSTSTFDLLDFIIKKSAHLTEYAIFATLLYRGFKGGGVGATKSGAISIGLAIFYAITDEIHQSFTPGRTPAVRDVMFDTIGSSLAIFIIWNILPRAPKRLKNLARDFRLI